MKMVIAGHAPSMAIPTTSSGDGADGPRLDGLLTSVDLPSLATDEGEPP